MSIEKTASALSFTLNSGHRCHSTTLQCQETAGLSLREYVEGYKEVYKFLCLMGTVFGWVGSDVYNKVVMLEKYMVGDKKEHYQTVKSMLEYEVRIVNSALISSPTCFSSD